MRNYLKRKFQMDDLQGINKYDIISDFILNPNSNEMDK